jgi:hypothetical protein
MATFGPSPRENPLTYPGPAPQASGLMTGGPFLQFERLRARRLSQARVVLGDDRPAALGGGMSRVTLGYSLLVLNAVPMEARVPVLAVGSNASIAQMQHKFSSAGISCVMPLTWANVTGVRVGVAAMISRWGYVPAAPVFDPGVATRLAINWLDPEQLDALDETEVGYDRRLVVNDGDAVHVELDSGEHLRSCGIYVPCRGVMAEPATGEPLDMPSSQVELIELLIGRGGRQVRRLAGDAEAFMALATDPERRRGLAEALLGSPAIGVVTSTGPTRPGDPQTYGRSRAGLPPPVDEPGAVRVAPSPDDINREGEPTIVMAEARWDELGRPSHVVIRSCMDPSAPEAVGRVIATGDDAEVLVDQAIRNGMGIEIGEHVALAPTGVPRSLLADALLSRPHSLLCRVQQAELVTSERRAALLSRLALELIGIESGDRVVIEGLPAEPGGRLCTVTVRAFEAPAEILDRRERLGGGGFEHRFPSARDALGVYPDLPGIFIDRALRSQLGFVQRQLAVVRVRASRKDQVTKEMREMLLVVVLAFIGLLQVVDVGWVWVPLLFLATLMVVGIVGMRLRSRLREV